MGEIQDEGEVLVEDEVEKHIEDEGDPAILEVKRSENVGSSGQLG